MLQKPTLRSIDYFVMLCYTIPSTFPQTSAHASHCGIHNAPQGVAPRRAFREPCGCTLTVGQAGYAAHPGKLYQMNSSLLRPKSRFFVCGCWLIRRRPGDARAGSIPARLHPLSMLTAAAKGGEERALAEATWRGAGGKAPRQQGRAARPLEAVRGP